MITIVNEKQYHFRGDEEYGFNDDGYWRDSKNC